METSLLQELEGEISAILRKYGIREAAVFGSLSRGEADPQSDVDLLVTYPAGIDLLDTFSLQDELEAATGKKVDLVSKKYIPARLEKRIKSDLTPLELLT